MDLNLRRRQAAASVDELLAGAAGGEQFHPAETRSTVRFERVEIDGQRCIVKYLSRDDDFILRATGDPGARIVDAYEAGLIDVAADVIDSAILGMARGTGPDGQGCAVLMRDVSAHLVPPGDDPFPEVQHNGFVDHLATMCARTWGWRDDLGLLPYARRWGYFDVGAIEADERLGWPEAVPKVAADGWVEFAERAPAELVTVVEELRRDLSPLADALASTPSCFLHGDWKASNLGSNPDGQTILIDWVYLGEGPACHELGWYLALNRLKLPPGYSKERVIDDFRAALQREGINTDAWWDRQLGLSLLGTVVQFGWEKALGDRAELAWWCEQAVAGTRWL